MILADIHLPPGPEPPTIPIPLPLPTISQRPHPFLPSLMTSQQHLRAPSQLFQNSCAPLFGHPTFSPPSPPHYFTPLFCSTSVLSERQLPPALLKPLMKPLCDSTCSPLPFCGKASVVSPAGRLPATKCTPSDSGFGERAEDSSGASSGKKPC